MTGPELIGRDRAAAVVRAELDRALTSHGGVVLLAGEAGIGKTALAREIAEEARGREAIVAVATSWDGAGAPGYWPWMQLVRALERAASDEEWTEARAGAGDALSRLLGEATAPGATGSSSTVAADAAFRLADAVTTLLVTLARRRPVVVVLDDLHWADAASLELLAFVARHAWFERVLVVGTYRDVEVEAAGYPARESIESLLTNATSVPLTGLDVDEVRRLMERVVGAEVDHQLAVDVHRRTGGNPFFVEQTVRLHAADGPMDAIPPGIRATLGERLGRLPAEASELLGLAAAAGREFDPAVLTAAEGRDGGEVDGLLAHALTARLVTKLGPGRLAFVHDLVRETLLAEMDDATRRRRHAALVQGWERLAADGRPPAPSVLARHAHLAVPDVPAEVAFDHLMAASEDACARLAAAEVVDLLRRGLELLDADDLPRRAELRLDLAAAERAAGDLTAARETFEQVVAAARQLPDVRLLAHAVLGLHELGIPDPGRDGTYELALVDEAHAGLADAGVEPCDPVVVRVLAAASRIRTHLGVEPDVAAASSAQALEHARRCGDDDALGFALLARHDVIWEPGTTGERRALTEEMAEVARRHGDDDLGLQASLLRSVALLEQGDPAAVKELASLEATAGRVRAPRFVFQARSRRGALATLTGRFEEAREAIDEAFALGEQLGEVDRHRLWLEQRWLLALLEGDEAEAGRLLDRYGEVGAHDAYPLPAVLTAGWRGDLAAVRRMAPAVSSEADVYPGLFRAAVLCLEVELAVATDDRARRDAVRQELEPLREQWAVVAGAGAIYGPYAMWLARLDAADERWDDAVAGLEAARSVADHLGARAWSLEAGVRLAETLLARGAEGDAVAAAELAVEVANAADALGMRGVAERARALATRVGDAVPETRDGPSADDVATSVRRDGTPGPASADHGEFRFDGHVWHLGFAGRAVQVPEAKGLRDLHALLGLPGQDVSVADLVDPSGGEVVRTSARLSGDAVLDERAKAEYRQRLTELGERIEAALSRGDDDRAAELDTERAALLDELRRATGLGGRARRLGDEMERARKTVTARIRDTLRRLDDRHPELAEHLRASVSTGTACRYQPAREIHWQR